MSNDLNSKLEEINKKRVWEKNRVLSFSEFREIETDWYIKNNLGLEYYMNDNLFKANLNENKTYITYLEKNIDFNTPPKHNKNDLNSVQKYEIKFMGEKTGDIDVKLFIVTYHNGKKKNIHSLNLNNVSTLTCSEEHQDYRLAVRVTGNGTFIIKQITIGEQSYWKQALPSVGKHQLEINKNWFVKKSNQFSINDGYSYSFNLEKDYLYLTYKAQNSNFKEFTKDSLIKIKSDTLSVSFEGKKTDSLDIKIAIVLYKEGTKFIDYQIPLNDKRLIKIPKDIDYMRLAIRVAGCGDLEISNVIINNYGYWEKEKVTLNNYEPVFMEDFSIRLFEDNLIGWEEENKKIIYYPDTKIFESTLQGNAFSHLVYTKESDQRFNLPLPKNSFFTIFPKVCTSGDVSLDLFLMGMNNGKKVETKQLSFNRESQIQFSKKIDDISILIRVKGQGYFNNLSILFKEEKVSVTNNLSINLNKSNWFEANKKLLQLSNDNNTLIGQVNTQQGKHVYLSYKEENNNYNLLPENHLMTVQSEFVYEFDLSITLDEGVDIIPMIIGYSSKGKVQIIQLNINSTTTIEFHEDVNQFRFAIRASGLGKFKINEITVREKERILSNNKRDYIDKFEVGKLELTKSKPLKKMKMAVIFDEFTTAAYKYECELVTFTPENWLEVLTSEQPDILMVESAWNGNGGSWNKKVGYYGEANLYHLNQLLTWCKRNNVPTVFWNKEDPVHFNRFIETARRFDYIYTTDENMVNDYQEKAGHKRVYALPFAAQPLIHNPIKITDEREDKSCFAGSYYKHHEERCVDMDRLLDAAAPYGLEIYDRNYHQTQKGLMPNHRFPDRFKPYIKGNLKYYEIDKAYKGYKVMINVNTVKHSPTMFSRRVFEGLACGTPVVSTYAKGIKNIFGDLVDMSENSDDLNKSFKDLLLSDEKYREKSIKGIREVLSKHTYAHRLNEITSNIGINFRYEMPYVSVIAIAKNLEEYYSIVEKFNKQNYANKVLYILVDTFEGYVDLYNKYNNNKIKTFVRSYMHNYSSIIELIDTPYVAYFSLNDYYGENYLLDLMLSTTYTDSDFIGKWNYFLEENGEIIEKNPSSEYEFVTNLSPKRSIAKTKIFYDMSLEELILSFENSKDLSRYFKYGSKFYSSDRFNYLENGGSLSNINRSIIK
ncbi:glycosyltransferase [Sutcliffiella horikoshii]|uniref:CgeB family protein n=1 Tax=Sutcliffiella horikoshii TaxID=79883 RepID=UPI00384BF627